MEVSEPESRNNHRDIAIMVARARAVIQTGAALRSLRETHGVGRETLAAMIGVTAPQLATLEQRESPPDSPLIREAWRESARIIAACAEVMRADSVGQWLVRPMPELEGDSPFELFQKEGPDSIWELVREI
jgi:transcriptional regulator with XRE-family HTH domain